jgi:hypothetical protein
LINTRRLDRIIANGDLIDPTYNYNKVSEIILINFFLKILKLGLVILNICFFLGMIWMIIADTQMDLTVDKVYQKNDNDDRFMSFYKIEGQPADRLAIIGMYFAFTTLSTVGFGDYTPRSNFERCVGAFILISGVAMFSYLMGNFIDILGSYQDLNAEFDDGDTLTKFFGAMKHFNNDVSLDIDFRTRIEAHFDYKWNNDRNLAISHEAD